MFRRIFGAHLVLLILSLGVLGLLAARSTRRRVVDEIGSRLESEARMLRSIARAGGPLQERLSDLGASLESRFTVIAPDGTVLADSDARPPEMENHNGRPEVVGARASGRGEHRRFSETVRAPMMYVALRMDPDRGDGLIVRSALPLTSVEEELRGVYQSVLLAFGILAFAGAGVSYVLARRLTRPLREVQEAAQAAAEGDFTRRAPLQADAEVASVASALNRMTDELQARLERLEGERSKIDAVVSSMQEAVVAVDAGGAIQHANGAAEGLLGIGRSAVGHRLWEVLRVPGLEEAAGRALREGSRERVSAEVGPRAVALRLSPIPGGRGAVLVAHDVTEERRYDALRREFVANVSHELRTPLTLVQGFVETLREGAWKDAERAPEFLETIDRNVQRLRGLVEDLLQISRLESGGAEIFRPRELQAGDLLARLRETFAPLAARKGQQLSVEAAPLAPFRGDPDLLDRALANLVDNAIKYTPEGGRILVGASEEDGAVVFRIEDTGIGIPEADQARVFERFYRVDKSRSRELGGTGLGLSIVKHVAQLHGGAVSLASAPGKGSVFSLRVPRGGSTRGASSVSV